MEAKEGDTITIGTDKYTITNGVPIKKPDTSHMEHIQNELESMTKSLRNAQDRCNDLSIRAKNAMKEALEVKADADKAKKDVKSIEEKILFIRTKIKESIKTNRTTPAIATCDFSSPTSLTRAKRSHDGTHSVPKRSKHSEPKVKLSVEDSMNKLQTLGKPLFFDEKTQTLNLAHIDPSKIKSLCKNLFEESYKRSRGELTSVKFNECFTNIKYLTTMTNHVESKKNTELFFNLVRAILINYNYYEWQKVINYIFGTSKIYIDKRHTKSMYIGRAFLLELSIRMNGFNRTENSTEQTRYLGELLNRYCQYTTLPNELIPTYNKKHVFAFIDKSPTHPCTVSRPYTPSTMAPLGEKKNDKDVPKSSSHFDVWNSNYIPLPSYDNI